MVLTSPSSASAAPVACVTASRGKVALTSQAPSVSPSGVTSSSSSSVNSSSISPTISSSTSSRVTMPSTPPNSSTTIAICNDWRRIRCSRSSTAIFSTTNSGSRIMLSGRPSSFRPSNSAPRASLIWTMPTTSSIVSRYTGRRVCRLAMNREASAGNDIDASTASTSRRGTIMSFTSRSSIRLMERTISMSWLSRLSSSAEVNGRGSG